MVTIEELDSDSLRAILLRVPLRDFVTNLKLVSTQFRTAAESAFNEKIERDPIDIWFNGRCSCSHYEIFPAWYPFCGSPRVYLANVRVPLSKFSEIANSSLLPYVSKVYLDDPFCTELRDFVPHLNAIMEKINAASDIQFTICAAKHYGKSSARHADRIYSRGAFREGAFMCASALSNTKSLSLSVQPMRLSFSRGDKMDFLQALHFTEQLTSLVVPTSIFAFVVPKAKRVFAHLESLEITADRYQKTKLSCQDVIEMVCDNCPNLNKFQYNCNYNSDYTCGSRRGCIYDLNPLIKLNNLRSLTLDLSKAKLHRNEYPIIGRGRLPLVEFLKLIVFRKVQNFSAILRMVPNVKELYFEEIKDLRSLYEEMRTMLISGQLAQLRAMRIASHQFCHSYISLLTQIDSAVPLRRLDLQYCYDGIFLGTPTEEDVHRRGIPPVTLDVPQCVRQASNVTHLLIDVSWRSDGYTALADVLVAMQEGSLQQLTMRTYGGEIDRGSLEAVLPAGCGLHQWQLKGSVVLGDRLDFVLIRGHKIRADADCQFWVRLIMWMSD